VIARERPARGEAAGALVLFHGRGADENDLYPLLDALDPERRLDGYTPRGPLSLPPGGAHWYIVPRVGYPDRETFAASYAEAAAWLDALPHERIVLGGFSQGCVMALALGLGVGRPRPAAITGFSGFIPQVDGWELDAERPLPPVALGHGTLDPVIEVEFGRAARDRLVAAGAPVLYREYPLPHTLDAGFLGEVAVWLGGVLAQVGPATELGVTEPL
jgi:phospholipase/carboxylesterase